MLPLTDAVHPWVARHVVPFLHTVPPHLDDTMTHGEAGRAVAAYLEGDRKPEIVADWPEDIALFCRLLMPSPADVEMTASIVFHYYRTPGFKTAAASKVPHNALHDARALRDFVLAEEAMRG